MGNYCISGILLSVILLSGILGVISFEDAEAAKKPKEIVVVGSKVKEEIKDAKLTECTIDFLDESARSLLQIISEDKGGKIKADVPEDAVSAEIQCTFKDGSTSQLLVVELDDDKKQKIKIQQSGSDSRVDSFFDVFFDVELYTVDSFFDIFTELQTDVDRLDGHVTVLKEQDVPDLQESATRVDSFFDVFFDVDVSTGERNTPDSFFDIFTTVEPDGTTTTPDSFFDVFIEIDARDGHVTVLKEQVDANTARMDSFFDVWTEISIQEALDAEAAERQAADDFIQTEIVALDLRGQSCSVGQVVTGIADDGTILCKVDATGSGGPSLLSCSNQLAILASIPAFTIDPSCLLPLTLITNDQSFSGPTFGGGLCDTTISGSVSGGQTPYSWSIIELESNVSELFTGGLGIGALIFWDNVGGNGNDVKTFELTVNDSLGSSTSDIFTLTCT